MIQKILIANRGEIACRIIQTCQNMGIATVAVYSEADKNALFVDMADEAFYIGGSPVSESYLNSESIISAARKSKADAIHPGYGFLSENAVFAQKVIDAGMIFIGPPPSAIEMMGKKRESKWLLKDIPLVPGYEGEDQADNTFLEAAKQIGFPIMIKASAGGGGKGMRRVNNKEDIIEALAAARREANQAFGDATLILEKYIQNSRHIEIQIFGDQHGNVIALGERECSIQRRHQKILEETPSTALNYDLRQKMCDTAVSIGRQLGYYSAGTIEFLLDADGNFYFMEMNTRLQVEHPITEMVTGQDLVRWQIEVAEGGRIPSQVHNQGHAIEVRVYAEDPSNSFLPVTGKILHWETKNNKNRSKDLLNIRVDTGICSGDEITVYYDPMLAKIISYGETRTEAIRRLDDALRNTHLLGLRNNIFFLRNILNHPEFIAGNTTTHFIENYPELLSQHDTNPATALIGAAIAKHKLEKSDRGYWRNNAYGGIKYSFKYGEELSTILIKPTRTANNFQVWVKDAEYTVEVIDFAEHKISLIVDGHRQKITFAVNHDVWWIDVAGVSYELHWENPLPLVHRSIQSEGSLRAPMPGQIISINVTHGEHVAANTLLMTLEAMKMEHRIQAPYDGTVASIYFSVGESVQADAVLLELKKEDS